MFTKDSSLVRNCMDQYFSKQQLSTIKTLLYNKDTSKLYGGCTQFSHHCTGQLSLLVICKTLYKDQTTSKTGTNSIKIYSKISFNTNSSTNGGMDGRTTFTYYLQISNAKSTAKCKITYKSRCKIQRSIQRKLMLH